MIEHSQMVLRNTIIYILNGEWNTQSPEGPKCFQILTNYLLDFTLLDEDTAINLVSRQ